MGDDVYEDVKQHFSGNKDVAVADGRGAQGVKHGKKMFAMFYKGELLLKLPPIRVTELVEGGVGRPYDPGTGSAMKDRVLVPAERREEWITLCEEALRYAMGR